MEKLHSDKKGFIAENNIQAVIFDMDGVIFDTEQLIIDCWLEVARRHDIPDIKETLYRCIGTNSRVTREITLGRYGEDFPYEEYQKEVKANWKQYLEKNGMPVKQGAKEILSALYKAEIPLALASSTKKEMVVQELEMAGLFSFFRKIICGDMVSKSKPEPDIFLAAAGELGVLPEYCVVIEDSFNGIRAAHAASMHPVMVPDLLQPTQEIIKLAEFVLPTLKAAGELLLGENNR